MKRSNLNFIIDAILFMGLVLLVSTGLAMRFLLPAGVERLERGQLILWGMSRHQWGDVHFYIAVGLMVILAAHLVLHWRWVVSVGAGERRQNSRLWLGALAVSALLFVAVAPFLSPVEKKAPGHRRGPLHRPEPPASPTHLPRATDGAPPATDFKKPPKSHAGKTPELSSQTADEVPPAMDFGAPPKSHAGKTPEPPSQTTEGAPSAMGLEEPPKSLAPHAPYGNKFFIRGGMTLKEFEEARGMPYRELLMQLGLPTDIDPEEKLGRLAKRYGFTMEEVRRIAGEWGGG